MEVGDGGAIKAWILLTPNSSLAYSKRNTTHARLTCTRIWRALIVCALVQGKDARTYS